ncbi:MAG TPA: HesA/MoeB/ThiF family protein [Candidatus Hydrogenedentes bacterium]|nr:HesA/MoeB/ThiF family protein [Candidatus Hydrogenedentota bacterium]HOV75881.1 HesA/MoeB/ThiF family protein [Candidatus Hydrogenedentota bacterium]HPC15082.1 HesA/MoeB/ThiF family protein [Candidatus Hydrogenedentota bacterium]HRT19057.1 HesA/MoeB/ThiF family protein [Candidatus Hydrogenedentota bacterium]HRT63986.1 HesA/MoeB/ThiF family protein [Candidatus Hydrogenedentota bacterium]
MSLSDQQRARYARNILVPGFGEAGQERCFHARVLIAGLGGLGSPAAYYLAAAGVGTLGLLDFDVVDVSNLQRQILHTTDRIGASKVDSAAAALSALNPDLRIERIYERLTAENAQDILRPYDVVIEASDNFAAKFIVNDACVALRKPFTTAGVSEWGGQMMFVCPGLTACLRCAVPEEPPAPPAPFGILGAVPGIFGGIEALEALRYLAGQWAPRSDGAALLHTLDGTVMRFRTLPLPPRDECPCRDAANKT